jgi:hypothetical protein
MTSETIKTCFLVTVVLSLLLVAGCAAPAPETDVGEAIATEPVPEPAVTEPEPEPPPTEPVPEPPPQIPESEAASLVLKFEPGDATTYKLITEGKRTVTYEGSLANDPAFKGGDTGDRVEMTFSQLIESVNDRGNAIARITVKELRYEAQVKSDTVLDFDSSREQDQDNALAKLVGQSYTIELTPTGQVTEVVDSKEAQAAVKGAATARRLVESDTIKQRHSIPALPAAGKNKVRVDEHWSRIKSYEKIYVLKEVRDQDGKKKAVVEMNAIPTAETAEQIHQEQPAGAFSKMFDNVEEYTGQLQWDLTAGKVLHYLEEMKSEWLVVDPMARQKPDKKPDSLRMTAFSLYSLERVD